MGATEARMEEAAITEPEWVSPRREAWMRLRRNKLAIAGMVIISIIVLTAIFADFIATQPTAGFNSQSARQAPSAEHWFGTDVLGRDMFSRVIHGARFSMIVGFSVVSITLVTGVLVGGIAGFYGGWIDTIFSRVIDIWLGFPYLVGTIILVTALGGGKFAVVVALAFFGWVSIARLFRSSVISVRNEEFIEAARALGASRNRIFFRHVLPNAITPTLVYGFALIGAVIISEAALSFLGLGVQEPEPSWGLMLAKGRQLLRSEPHLVLFPGMALTFTSLGFILLGDGLRDALDPKLR
jgi:peptide/nickel transport system permease protein